MSNFVSLYAILFEADDIASATTTASSTPSGQDSSKALKDALKPVNMELTKIRQTIGKKPEKETTSISTKGTQQTSDATTTPKGPGTVSPSATTGTSKPSDIANALTQDKKFISTLAGEIASNMEKNKK